jgi:hypothetical protein
MVLAYIRECRQAGKRFKIFFVITTIPQKTGDRGQTVTWRQYFSYSCEGRKPLGLPKSGQEKYG